MIQNGIRGGEKSTCRRIPYRVDVYDGMDNQAMFLANAYDSGVSQHRARSVMEFYPKIGVERGVGSRPDQSHLGLRALTSVKYLFCEENKDYNPMHGFTYYDSQNGFKIYENQNYLPMGFTYDYYMDEGQLNSVDETNRDRAMLRAVYLTTEQMMRNREAVQKLSDDALTDFSNEAYDTDVAHRRRQTCSSFSVDNHGFNAEITLDKTSLCSSACPTTRLVGNR
ncbi:MAG: YfhO family protein [Oscillospiraceae bacterium]